MKRLIVIGLMAAAQAGCAPNFDPNLAAGVKKVEQATDRATVAANETLGAICAHYQLADFTLQSTAVLLAVAGKPVPKKYMDAEGQAVSYIAGVCTNRPNDPTSVIDAVKKAVATLVDIRDRFKQP